jgi:hypothetical protein
MPRQKHARRFETRFGVSQVMLDGEAKWLQRELDDHLIYSLTGLKELLADLQTKAAGAEAELAMRLKGIPDRERLALKCMIARDVFHVGMLYLTLLRSSPAVQDATGTHELAPEELDKDENPRPALVFKESLFT